MDSSLLDADNHSLYEQLLIQHSNEDASPTSNSKSVVPKPGFCLKTKTDKNEKVFINICREDSLPAPDDISDEELVALLQSDDPTSFRIPMSLGEPHAELDKSGNGCTAYDVVINSGFYEKVVNRQTLLGFLLTVVLEGLEYKYKMSLKREWRTLKNRKFVGSLPEQNIRSKSKPLIMEMTSCDDNRRASPLVKEVTSTESTNKTSGSGGLRQPACTIVQEPAEGHPQFLVAEVHMPKVKSATSFTLDIGEDRVVLTTRSNVYSLDLYLPFNLIQEECGAQFDKETKILTITMPVQDS